MKKTLLVIIFLSFALFSKAQIKDASSLARPDTARAQQTAVPNSNTDTTVYDSTQVKAQFPGGMDMLYKFMVKNIRYPKTALENNIQGIVILKLTIEEDGSISAINVVQNPSPDLTRETVRVVKLFPKFSPGSINGVPVRCYYSFPFSFTLQNE